MEVTNQHNQVPQQRPRGAETAAERRCDRFRATSAGSTAPRPRRGSRGSGEAWKMPILMVVNSD